jgi:hypothetical protein
MTRLFNHLSVAIIVAATVSSNKVNLPAPTSGKTTTSGTTTSAATPINSISAIEQDMDAAGEGLPYGMPTNFGNYRHGRVNTSNPGGNNPGPAVAMLPWLCIFPVGAPSPDTAKTNTRVQVRNIYIYYLSKSKNQWILATGSNQMTGFYNNYKTTENYPSSGATLLDRRNETAANGGGTSVKLLPGYCYQGWSTVGIGKINNTDIAGVWAYCEARLILSSSKLPDDRNEKSIVLYQGGDYKNATAGTIADAAIGRSKFVTKTWRAFNMSTLTDAQWATAPAPPMNKFD